MSTSPNSLFSRQKLDGGYRDATPKRRWWRRILLAAIVFVAVAVAALCWYASTPQFANKVRKELISVLENSTGGRVELGAFRWRLLHLQLEADNLTIHGLEAPGEVPYVHVDKLLVRAKIISLFRAKIGLDYLGVDKPVVHLIVYKDGSTNQPVPKKKSAPLDVNKTINQVFDAAVDRAEINGGTLLLNQQAIPFALAANDLQVGIDYVPKSDRYDATVSIADITAQKGIASPLHSKLNLTAVMARNELTVPELTFAAGASTLAAHAHLSNFADPHWQFAADGTVDLREMEALAAVPGLEGGIVRLQVHGQGTKALFAVDGPVRLAGASYRTGGVNVQGLNASTNLHVTQDMLRVSELRATLARGGLVTADAQIDHWLTGSGAATAAVTAAQTATKPGAMKGTAKTGKRPVMSATSKAAAGSAVSQGIVHAHVQGFTLPSILAIVAPPKYQHLGFDTTADGNVKLTWTGSATDLAAEAQIALRAPAKMPSGAVPINGTIDVTYLGAGSSLLVHQLRVDTPGTHLQATGGVGLAAGAHAQLQTQLSVSNLAEFNQALVVFGAAGKGGSAALPVALHGQATFNGVVTGSVTAPSVSGHLAVNNFDVLLNQATATQTAVGPDGKPVPVAVAATAGSAGPTTFHVDSLVADAAYSPSVISVESALITHGATQVHATGQLHAHRTRHGWAFDKDAQIQATAGISQASVTDLLALAGQSTLPVTGTLNLQANVSGTLSNLNGGGHLSVTGGEVYGEAYKSLNADLQFAGQEVGAKQLTFLIGGGSIDGNGGYNLTSKRFHFEAQANGLDLDNFAASKKSPLLIHGLFAFKAQGSGTGQAPDIQADAHLTRLAIASPAGGPASTGGVDLTVKALHGEVTTDVQAHLSGAQAVLHAQTALSGAYQTQAKLTMTNLDINPFLQLFQVQGIRGTQVIAGDVSVQGPLSEPRQLRGDAHLGRIAIESQGITLGTDGGLTASLDDGVVQLQPLHITGGGTDVHAQGRAELFGVGRLLDAKATGTLDLKVAHTFDKDIDSSGSVDFNFTAGNTIEKPDLEGAVNFHDVNMAYGDLPNGVNHLNGSLVFDQGRLLVRDLKATSGGGDLTFGGFVAYQQGVYADLSIAARQVRVRYPAGISTTFDSRVRIQGTLKNLLVSGGVRITKFAVLPGLDTASFSSNGISPPPDPTAFGNKIRLDVHVTSSPQLDINNSYAKLAGDVDLHIRGTAADPAVLGHISLTEGEATFAGTHYVLQHGDIYFTNPVKIDPVIDLEASAHVEDYDIIISLNGTPEKLSPTFRSEPPLSEQDVFSLLALGRTQEEQAIYSEQQSQAGVNSTADSLLGGALNATLSSRINKLFGGGSVKIDPTFVGGDGNSTARITVQQQVSKKGTVTYATNVNSTAEQLIQGQYNLTQNVSVLAVRDESGVFSFEIKLHRRYR